MAAAPWADVPAKDTFFALVTGANRYHHRDPTPIQKDTN